MNIPCFPVLIKNIFTQKTIRLLTYLLTSISFLYFQGQLFPFVPHHATMFPVVAHIPLLNLVPCRPILCNGLSTIPSRRAAGEIEFMVVVDGDKQNSALISTTKRRRRLALTRNMKPPSSTLRRHLWSV